MSKDHENAEIEILNFEDLDVEELEERLETAAAGGITPDAWLACVIDCGSDNPPGEYPPEPVPGCPSDCGGGPSGCDGTT